MLLTNEDLFEKLFEVNINIVIMYVSLYGELAAFYLNYRFKNICLINIYYRVFFALNFVLNFWLKKIYNL